MIYFFHRYIKAQESFIITSDDLAKGYMKAKEGE